MQSGNPSADLVADMQRPTSPLKSVTLAERVDRVKIPTSALAKIPSLPDPVIGGLEELREKIGKRVLGQDAALDKVLQFVWSSLNGFARQARPLGVVLLCGPTGVGKTLFVEELSAAFFGKVSCTVINCAEFSERHAVSKLTGSPPGYLGYQDKGSARLSQAAIDKHQTAKNQFNFVLFDEIEKADETLWDALLSILDRASLVMGNGEEVDFSRTFVFMTSNAGAKQTKELLNGPNLGFRREAISGETGETNKRLHRTTSRALEKLFKPEFINRVNDIVLFDPISRDTARNILSLLVNDVAKLVVARRVSNFDKDPANSASPTDFHIVLDESALNFLMEVGFSPSFNARELERAVDRYVARRVSSLVMGEPGLAQCTRLLVWKDSSNNPSKNSTNDGLSFSVMDAEMASEMSLPPLEGVVWNAGSSPRKFPAKASAVANYVSGGRNAKL